MSKLGPISYFLSPVSCDSLVLQGLRCEWRSRCVKFGVIALTLSYWSLEVQHGTSWQRTLWGSEKNNCCSTSGFLNRRPVGEKNLWPALISNNVHENSNAASESDINLHRATRREWRGTTKYNITYYNQWCCLHWMLRSAVLTIPDSILLTRSIYDVLTHSSNDLQCL